MAATPALLGLAVTVKGDLLACVALALAVGWLLRIKASSSPVLAALLTMGSLGLAAGAKLLVWTSMPLLLLVALASLRRERLTARKWWLFGVASLPVLLTGLSRYIVNLFQFGHFFARTPGEQAVPSLANITGDLWGLFVNLFGHMFGVPDGGVWVLSQGWGITGLVLIVGLVLLPFTPMQRRDRIRVAVAVALLIGLLADFIGLPWLPSGARYFAPWVFIFATFVIARGLSRTPHSLAVAISFSALMVAGWHVFLISRSGEAIPAPGVGIGFEMERGRTGLQRKLAQHPYLLDGVGALNRVGIEQPGKTVLLLNRVNSASYPFFGENSANDVTLTDNAASLVKLASEKPYSLVAVSGPPFPEEESTVWKPLSAAGYQAVVNYEFWRIAARR